MDRPDASWRRLYTIGGAAVLEYIMAHKTVYLVELVCFVGLSLPALVVFTALSVSLKGLDKSIAAVGALIGIVSEVLALGLNASPPSLHGGLVYLSDRYAAAAADAQRLSLSTAAEGFIAAANAVSAAGILTALGILVLSLVMLKGKSRRGGAYLGIVTGALGMVFEALRPSIGMAYALFGLLLPAWFVVVGGRLIQDGRGDP